MLKSEKEVIEIIDRILEFTETGTDEQLDEYIWKLDGSVPFHQEIYNLLFFGNERLTAEEIYQKAKEEHKPILL